MSFNRRRALPALPAFATLAAVATPAAIAILLLAAAPASPQVTPADYERALALRAAWEPLPVDVPEPAVWADARRFTYRKTVPGGHRFVAYDVATGAKSDAFDHARLAASLGGAMGEEYGATRLPFSTFRYVDDGAAVVFGGFGAQWRCGLVDYDCARFEPSSAAGPRPRPRSFGVVRDLEVPADTTPLVSPDGRWELVSLGHDLGVRPSGGGEVTRLSRDGAADGFYELSSAVWSPDSRTVATYRVRPGQRRLVHYVEARPAGDVEARPAGDVQPRHFTELYAKPGDTVDIERPVIFHLAGPEQAGGPGQTAGAGQAAGPGQLNPRQVDVPDDLFPNPYTLRALAWRGDGRALTFEYNERGHQVYRVIEVDPGTGSARALITEEVATFFNYRPATGTLLGGGTYFRHDLDDGREILWLSERDGWKHLYLYDGETGRVKHQVTRGEWVVRGVVHVDEAAREVWFMAGGVDPDQDPYFVHYYRVGLDGTGLTPLTHHAAAYHEARFSPDMEYFVDTYSRVDLPPVAELRRARDGSLVMEIERGDASALLAAGWRPPEVFVAPGRDGETDIWGIIVRPTDFDPSRRYPVVENIYAGPHGSFVTKTFDLFKPHSSGDGIVGMQALAELGFIVVMIDGMGTANRSKAFHDVAWRDIGDAGFPDRIAWHRAVAERYPYYDITRVGIYGGSAGGQNALGALLFHPHFYHAAVAYVGCHDNRMDKISWNEAWMGWPVDDHYAASSNVDNAWRLQGEVLLVLGALDTNVDPASTMQVVDALVEADKTFELLVFPGDGHGAGRTVGPVRYANRAQYDFFVRHLQGQATPRWNRGP